MKAGEIQIEWVKSLRANPHRQRKSLLAKKISPKSVEYTACCLGELKLVECRLKSIRPNWVDGVLYDDASGYLKKSSKDLGLRDGVGSFKNPYRHFSDERTYTSLAGANDGGIGWVEIANFIEANPYEVFTKEVADAFVILRNKKPTMIERIMKFFSE